MLFFWASSLGMIKLLYIVGFPLSWKEPSEVGLCCSHVNATGVGWESLVFFWSNNCHGQKMTTIMARPFLLQNVSEPCDPRFPKPNGAHANWVYHIILDSRGWGTCGLSRLLHMMDSSIRTIRTVEFVSQYTVKWMDFGVQILVQLKSFCYCLCLWLQMELRVWFAL